MSRIMIVVDDPNIRELVGDFLRNDGFEVAEAVDGKEALVKLEQCRTDLVILDIMMPNMDGWQLCRELREQYDLPLLILTAKDEPTSKIKGFQLGTDDYMVKPFDPSELVLRAKALLRRYRIAVFQTIRIGDFVIDRSAYKVTTGSESITLPPKEFELLFKLAGNLGRIVSRENLIEDIWGYDFDGNERTLDVHINRLRERFPEKSCPFRIKTIRGLGHRMEVKQ